VSSPLVWGLPAADPIPNEPSPTVRALLTGPPPARAGSAGRRRACGTVRSSWPDPHRRRLVFAPHRATFVKSRGGSRFSATHPAAHGVHRPFLRLLPPLREQVGAEAALTAVVRSLRRWKLMCWG